MASFSLPLLRSGSILTFGADPSPVYAGGSDACHYPAWSFYLPVVVLPPQGGWQRGAGVVGRERALPLRAVTRVQRNNMHFLKLNPEHCAAPVPSRPRWLAEDVEGLSWPRGHGRKNNTTQPKYSFYKPTNLKNGGLSSLHTFIFNLYLICTFFFIEQRAQMLELFLQWSREKTGKYWIELENIDHPEMHWNSDFESMFYPIYHWIAESQLPCCVFEFPGFLNYTLCNKNCFKSWKTMEPFTCECSRRAMSTWLLELYTVLLLGLLLQIWDWCIQTSHAGLKQRRPCLFKEWLSRIWHFNFYYCRVTEWDKDDFLKDIQIQMHEFKCSFSHLHHRAKQCAVVERALMEMAVMSWCIAA